MYDVGQVYCAWYFANLGFAIFFLHFFLKLVLVKSLKKKQNIKHMVSEICNFSWKEGSPECVYPETNLLCLPTLPCRLCSPLQSPLEPSPQWSCGKASASRTHRSLLLPSSHASTIGTLVACLPGFWCYRISARAGWPGIRILWLWDKEFGLQLLWISVAAYMYNFLSRPRAPSAVFPP